MPYTEALPLAKTSFIVVWKKMLQKYALPPKRKEITLIKLGYYSAGWQKEFETIKND